jgi:hypothetical protein
MISRDSDCVMGNIIKRQHHFPPASFTHICSPVLENCRKDFGVEILNIKMIRIGKNFND